MSQIEIKIDGRVFKVGEEKIWKGERVTVKGLTVCGEISAYFECLGANGHFQPSELTDIPPKRTVPMTYEDLRDLVARERGGVEFELKNAVKTLFPVICNDLDGQLTIWGHSIENIRCYRLYSEKWAVEHPLTKEV